VAHGDFVDLFFFPRFLLFALSLSVAEHLQDLFVLAHEALLIDRESQERVFRAADRFGEDEGRVGFGMIHVPEFRVFGGADRE
jgi:hypothetical protein